MRDPARIKCVVSARLEIRDARAVDGLDLFDLRLRELLGLLDKDHVIFEREILVDIFLVLKMADLDRAVIGKVNNRSRWSVLNAWQDLRAKLLHRLFGRACFLAQEQHREPVELLAVIDRYLTEPTVRFAAAAGTAIGNVFYFIDGISQAGEPMELQLLRLRDITGEQKAFERIFWHAAILRCLDQSQRRSRHSRSRDLLAARRLHKFYRW